VSLEVPHDRSLRFTFDRVATEYAAARPPLPADLVDTWCALTGVPAAGRVLEVGSGHIALDDDHRTRLYACLRELLERDYGGRVRRATMTELCVARRR
jgi:hypothetical protein